MIFHLLDSWGEMGVTIIIAFVLSPCDSAINNAPWRVPNSLETHYDVDGGCRVTYRARTEDVPEDMRRYNYGDRNMELRQHLGEVYANMRSSPPLKYHQEEGGYRD